MPTGTRRRRALRWYGPLGRADGLERQERPCPSLALNVSAGVFTASLRVATEGDLPDRGTSIPFGRLTDRFSLYPRVLVRGHNTCFARTLNHGFWVR